MYRHKNAIDLPIKVSIEHLSHNNKQFYIEKNDNDNNENDRSYSYQHYFISIIIIISSNICISSSSSSAGIVIIIGRNSFSCCGTDDKSHSRV